MSRAVVSCERNATTKQVFEATPPTQLHTHIHTNTYTRNAYTLVYDTLTHIHILISKGVALEPAPLAHRAALFAFNFVIVTLTTILLRCVVDAIKSSNKTKEKIISVLSCFSFFKNKRKENKTNRRKKNINL